jgi:nuclear pore complex protein Nup155
MSPEETCVSGQSDIDYPSLSTAFPALKTMPFISDVNHVPIPKEVLHEFENMQCNSNMGLMSLIKRAWVTIDSTIYLWNYENGSDLAYFDGLNEIILSVGLVLPKVGVFKDHIHYLLVLTTPTEIIILGVSFVGNFNNGYY